MCDSFLFFICTITSLMHGGVWLGWVVLVDFEYKQVVVIMMWKLLVASLRYKVISIDDEKGLLL